MIEHNIHWQNNIDWYSKSDNIYVLTKSIIYKENRHTRKEEAGNSAYEKINIYNKQGFTKYIEKYIPKIKILLRILR